MTPERPTARDAEAPETGGERDADGGSNAPRWQAALAAVLLLVTGAVLGITVDRLWLSGPPAAGAAPLTVDAMARSLDLTPDDRARVRRVLDSLEAEVAEAARSGPDSLRSVARRARARLEGALPPDARPRFRQWMQVRHRQMMERMHGSGMGPMHEDGMGPGMGPMHEEGMEPMRPEGMGMGGMHRGGGTTPSDSSSPGP